MLVNRKEHYSSNRESVKANSKVAYDANPDVKKAASHASYSANPEKQKQASRASYSANPEKQKQASRDSYSANPQNKKQASRDSYSANPAQKKDYASKQYSANPNAKRLASRILYAKSRAQKNKSCSEHYREHQSLLCSNRRNRYKLAEPKRRVKDLYANVTQRNLVLDNKARIEVVEVVRKRFPIVVKRNLVSRIASGYAARRLVNKSLRVRKEHAGNLLKATREITRLSIKGEKDW